MSRLPPPFGPFEPLRRLGAGGMAETFVAVRRGPAGFEQHVCIKRILPAFEADKEFIESFLQEARTSAALRHANIVQLLDFGVADGAHYLALELIDGLDLRALQLAAQGRGRLPADLVTLIAGDLCAALEHAHADDLGRPKLVHRDISPSNVLVSRAGEVKLTDFGIARPSGGAQRTATGVIKGKVPYMPPEYIEHGLFDERGDLFSLGVMLYELLSGRRPFDGDTDLDTIRRIVAGIHTPLPSVAPETPPALSACVEALLCTAPAQRVPTARALLDALPALPVHQTRRRLAELVRSQLGSAPSAAHGALSRTVPLPRTPSAPAPPPEPYAAEPTRTARRSARRGPSRGALAALTLALACLGALAAAALWYSDGLTALTPLPGPVLQPAAPLLPPNAAPEPAASAPLPSASAAPAAALKPTASAAPDPDPEPELADPEPQDAPRAEPIILSRPSEPETAATRASAAPRAVSAGTARSQVELNIYVQPFGEVWVDGKRAGQSPVTLKLPAGEHVIGVGDGRIEQRQTVQLQAGKRESVEIHRRDVGE